MKPLAATLLYTAALFAPLPATAQPAPPIWLVAVEMRGRDYQSALFVDTSRIVSEGQVRRAWITIIRSPSDPLPAFQRVISLEEYDCAAERSRSLQMTGYTTSGNNHTLGLSAWGYVVPGSFGERMLRFLCGSPDAYRDNGVMMLSENLSMQEAADALFAPPSR